MREYIQLQLDVPAVDRTTVEILYGLKKKSINLDVVNLIREILDMSDLVKFAKFLTDSDEARKNVDVAHKVIDMTKPGIEGDVVRRYKYSAGRSLR